MLPTAAWPQTILGGEPRTPLRSPALEHETAALGLHARPEPMVPFASEVTRLKGSLHGLSASRSWPIIKSFKQNKDMCFPKEGATVRAPCRPVNSVEQLDSHGAVHSILHNGTHGIVANASGSCLSQRNLGWIVGALGLYTCSGYRAPSTFSIFFQPLLTNNNQRSWHQHRSHRSGTSACKHWN